MTTWIIEPHDPLIVRDGRPFGPDPGARATSLPFPFPSTTTGGIRTRAGVNKDGFFDLDGERLDALKHLAVRGPLLAQLAQDSNDIVRDKWLIPAPGDALLFETDSSVSEESTALIQQLVPLQLPGEIKPTFDGEPLLFVGQIDHNDRSKPVEDAPHFWHWKIFLNWLHHPSMYSGKSVALSTIGLHRLPSEQRMHVSIDADREVAREGMLFQTGGLEFTAPGKREHRLSDAQRLALAIAVDDHAGFVPRAGLAGFAGERRLVTWRKSGVDFPPCPSIIEDAIIASKACRVFLFTPACFENGYRPTWLLREAAEHKVIAKLRAVAIQRPQVVSGWDLAIGKPKPSRRLAPAGTVLFLTLEGSEDTIRKWIRDTWMHSISDKGPDRLDGFGLAVLGAWSGQPATIQKGEQS